MPVLGPPSNLYVQTADAKDFISWSMVSGATGYSVQRSTDGINFTALASPTTSSYLDTAVTVGTQYWYQVATVNGSGTGAYTAAQTIVPAPPGEIALLQIRTLAQQRADRVNSPFVTLPEWNDFIRLACYELYDFLIGTYEDWFLADPVLIQTNGTSQRYALPDGMTNFTNAYSGGSFVAPAFYRVRGLDLGVQNTSNGFVTLKKFNFADRNKYFYPNSASTIYGVYNMSYRVMDKWVYFIPIPSGNQSVRIWYIPRLTQLLQDTDYTSDSISGWIEYVVIRAAKYALDKEESDTSALAQELLYIKQRIEAMGQNRDVGQPDTIQDTRGGYGWNGPGNGFQGGY